MNQSQERLPQVLRLAAEVAAAPPRTQDRIRKKVEEDPAYAGAGRGFEVDASITRSSQCPSSWQRNTHPSDMCWKATACLSWSCCRRLLCTGRRERPCTAVALVAAPDAMSAGRIRPSRLALLVVLQFHLGGKPLEACALGSKQEVGVLILCVDDGVQDVNLAQLAPATLRSLEQMLSEEPEVRPFCKTGDRTSRTRSWLVTVFALQRQTPLRSAPVIGQRLNAVRVGAPWHRLPPSGTLILPYWKTPRRITAAGRRRKRRRNGGSQRSGSAVRSPKRRSHTTTASPRSGPLTARTAAAAPPTRCAH